MNLQEHFNYEISETDLKEFPSGSGVFHIPILNLKQKLSKDFLSWGTENVKTQIILRGNEIITSTSLELNLVFDDMEGNISQHKFVGAFTFKDSRYAPNDDLEGIGIAEALKNASKNIGKAYGLLINSDLSYLPTYTDVKSETTKPNIKKTITKIIKEKS